MIAVTSDEPTRSSETRTWWSSAGGAGPGASVSCARTRAREDRLDVHAAEEDHHRVREGEGEDDGDARDGDGGGLRQRVEHVGGRRAAVAQVAAEADGGWRARVMYMVESTTVVMWA